MQRPSPLDILAVMSVWLMLDSWVGTNATMNAKPPLYKADRAKLAGLKKPRGVTKSQTIIRHCR